MSNGVKILYIITQADDGGAQKYTLALAKYFGGMIAAGDEASKLFDDAKAAGLETYELKHLKRDISPWHDFWAVWEIRQLIHLLRPDIVHLNSTKAGILGSFASVGLKPKVVFTAHGFRFNEPLSYAATQFYLALEKIASCYRDYIIAVSDSDKKSALANKIISQEKISTIHNGLGPVNFLTREEARSALKLPADKLIIGCVANFYKTKGVDVLIEAIKMLADDTKNKIQVTLIGEGREHAFIQSSDVIKKLGKLENAAKYLKAFDIFVLPSRKEGFPYALLEAMQAGLPIVATDVGGNREALGAAAILVQPQNPKALAEAITDIIDNEQKRKGLSQTALERSKLFTEKKMLLETKKVYEQLLIT